MHREIEDLQGKLKEILYDCATELKATKAALFLLDQPTNRFELVTEYGFKGTIQQTAEEKHPIVDRCERGRTSFFVNGLAVEPRFSEILFQSQTDRMLVAPIYLRGGLVGFVDMRDKAGKALFENADLPKAQGIADRVGELFKGKNVFGQRFITLSGKEPLPAVFTGVYSAAALPASAPFPAPVIAPPPAPAPAPPPAPPPPAQAASVVLPVSTLILEARTAAERIRQAATADTLSEAEMNIVRDVLRAVLLMPGALVAIFSAPGHLGGIQEIAARTLLGDDATALMLSKLQAWLSKRGESAGPLRNHLQTPFGTTGAAIREEDIKKVFTAPIAAGSVRNLYLSVGFANEPERSTHELLAAFHQQLQTLVEQSIGRRRATADRSRSCAGTRTQSSRASTPSRDSSL